MIIAVSPWFLLERCLQSGRQRAYNFISGQTKPNKSKPRNQTDRKAKLMPLPRMTTSVFFLKRKVQVSGRLTERDQLQYNQFWNYRGMWLICSELIAISYLLLPQIAFYSADDFNFDYLADYLDEVLCQYLFDCIQVFV